MSGSGLAREMNRTQKVEAAFTNAQITRERCKTLEHDQRMLTTWVMAHDGFLFHSSFWSRLRWLVRGR